MIRSLIIMALLVVGLTSYAVAASFDKQLDGSQQLLLVATSNWDALQGTMQRYKRDKQTSSWAKDGNAIPVVVGQHGMAWGVNALGDHPITNDVLKKEGDLRTPAGIFPVGTGFGFAAQPDIATQLNYMPLTDTTVCVDDQSSQYYNQIVDQAAIKSPDWHSAEQMRQVSVYEHGVVVDYNSVQPVQGSGSCIFLHSWLSADKGTAGCIAMATDNLKEIFAWLDASKKPMIVLLPQDELKKLNLIIN